MVDQIGKYVSEWPSILVILLNIVLSVVLGAIIGWERSNKRHTAGLRTFMIVSLSSTLAMMLDDFLQVDGTVFYYTIPAAVIIAVGIISCNTTVYTSRSQIKGITTSVGLWGSCVIGLTLGAGFYTATIIAFIAILLCLSIFPKLEIFLKNKSNHFEVHLELKSASYLKDFVTTIRELGLIIDDIESNPAYINSGLSVYSISISITNEELKKYKSHREIIDALKTLEYVYYIEEM